MAEDLPCSMRVSFARERVVLSESIAQVLITTMPFVLVWSAMLRSLDCPYWTTLLLAVPAAGLLVRFFGF